MTAHKRYKGYMENAAWLTKEKRERRTERQVTHLKPSEVDAIKAWADKLGLPVATLVREALDSRGLLEPPIEDCRLSGWRTGCHRLSKKEAPPGM